MVWLTRTCMLLLLTTISAAMAPKAFTNSANVIGKGPKPTGKGGKGFQSKGSGKVVQQSDQGPRLLRNLAWFFKGTAGKIMIAWLVSFQSINILVDPRFAVRGKGIVHIGNTTTAAVSLILLRNVLIVVVTKRWITTWW